MKVKIEHWFELKDGEVVSEIEIYEKVECVKLEDQYHLSNGNWIYIKLKKTSPQYRKHTEMNGWVWINYDQDDDITIF